MAHTYTRTVTVVPSSAEYSWTNPATGWITINQVGSSDTWEITVNDNQTNQARSATLTVNHADGTTTNSINVNQAAGNGSITITPSPTPVPPITPTPGPSIETISLGPKNSSVCNVTTANTFNYTDNGIFQVGDSIPGAESNGQAVRVVTAATGSASTQVGKVFAIQEDEIMSIGECTSAVTISFGAVGVTECGAASTTDTYSYADNGVFTVGDSISGALPNSQGSRQVTAATGSASAQVGKVFGFMEDEIMGISDCVNAFITLSNNGTSANPLNFSSGSSSRAVNYTIGPSSGTATVTNLPSWLDNNQTSSSSTSGTINLSANVSLINDASATITVTSSAGAVDYIYVYYNAAIVEEDNDDKVLG